MSRGVRWFLVGGVALFVLAGCGRNWFAEREPWRREAEEACLKSGAVKEGPAVTMLKSIDGPGVCGANYPIKVGALGDSQISGYADDLRPPGDIPGRTVPRGYPANTPFSVNPDYPADTRLPPRGAYGAQPGQPPSDGGPISLTPPGVAPADPDAEGEYATPLPTYRNGRASPSRPAYDAAPLPAAREVPRNAYPGRALPSPPPGVPLSPSRSTTVPAGPATIKPNATLACPIVSALDRWVVDSVQPAALRWFGQPVTEIKQISAYSCRGMNGQPGARISEHAFGNALDIAGFTFADGRTITIKGNWRGTPEEQGFLHDVQLSACEQFTTVLAPGSNVFHYDHIHLDLMRRASGRRICQPTAIPGEVAAARARARYAAKKGGEPSITGSISSYQARRPPMRLFQTHDDDEPDRHLPRAIPGED